ncbi:MAG: Trk system potassium transporter TrkA [Lachnospiraceae bacterium]|nr:Trk system potassium transporter TrkA [Lachnospiraceae bacterium]
MKRKNTPHGGLHIIIVGCGKVGETLTEQLTKEGHDITLIDKDAAKLNDLSNLYDVMGIVGTGASYSIQMEAGIEEADLLIAVTDSDELNLLCCTVAKRVGNCAAIARVRNPDYSEEIPYLREKLGLAMIINPEQAAAHEAARLLYLPTALEVHPFAHGQAEMVKFKIPEKSVLDGMSIAETGRNGLSAKILICGVEREEEMAIPDGSYELKAGDMISFVASRKDAKAFLEKIGLQTRQVRDTMIIGGGKAAYYLAKRLLDEGIQVKLIEKDTARCEELTVLLPEAIIINGDGTDTELLKEEGIDYIQSFVPLTGIDEENVLLTLHARTVSDAKLVTKINRINFKTVINELDLGSVLYPKYITSEAIIAYVRARMASLNSNVETLYHLFDSRAEAVEFLVREESPVTGKPLMELKLKTDLLVSCIFRNGKIIIPSGNDCIMVGDTVLIVTAHTGLGDLQDILA